MSSPFASLLLLVVFGCSSLSVLAEDKANPPVPATKPAPITISSLKELADAASGSGQTVQMKPGVYRLNEYFPLNSVAARRKAQQWQFLTFSGSRNTFDLTGVTIELDTALRQALRSPIHTDEFLISGSNNTLKGLTITSVGEGKANGGAVVGVAGRGNALMDVTVHVSGSQPYGYGDLFGKGGLKHSAVHITGSGSRFTRCKVFTKSFGHAFYLQENCNDVVFEDCYAEGVMRPSDEMLAETSGMAFERKFAGVSQNRSGTSRIQPGYMKALSEDGFRTYHMHTGLVFKNCTAKNMRGGFEIRTKTAPRLENCTVIGCERGFWVSTGAVLTGCKGDAMYGPLLYLEGDRAKVDVQLLPDIAEGINVHAVATIYGTGNGVKLTGTRPTPAPILIGSGPPSMGDAMAPFSVRDTKGLQLQNETTLPVIIGAKAKESCIVTKGKVTENQGKDVEVKAWE